MKVYNGIEELPVFSYPVVTLGTFDGVHIGHKKVIKQLIGLAKKKEGETVLLTFHPHPRIVLYPDNNDLKLLNTIEEKKLLLENAGIDHLIIHPFTKHFAEISSERFVSDVLVNKIGVKELVIGYNHQFGKNREGTFEKLKEDASTYNFKLKRINAQEIENIQVSSTKIRKALLSGNIKKANSYLGYDYPITGKVVDGKKIGKSIGFPTANIEIENKFKLIPANGVYAVQVAINNDKYNGMLNIGMRPTFNGKNRNIEVHIFDFNQNIYDQFITIYFKEKIRNERKFDGLESLKKQLIQDKETSIALLSL